MRKVLKTNHKRELGGLDTLAALTLTMSLAVFGCTTNRNPGNGEPATGPMKTPTSTPGSSSGTTVTPPTMVSSSPDAPSPADAIAILKANEAYRGKILGPADPGGPQRSEIALQATGQYVPPMANPQLAVNSSVSSTPVPAITSRGAVSAIVVPTAGSPSVTAASATVSAPSTTTTPFTAITSDGGVTAIVVPTAGSPAVTAASATVSAPSAATTITSATAPAGTTVPVITTPLKNAAAVSNRVVKAPSTTSGASSGTPVVGTASAPIRIESPGTGVVVTNQSPSLAQRFLRFIGVRRGTTAPPATTTSTPE